MTDSEGHAVHAMNVSSDARWWCEACSFQTYVESSMAHHVADHQFKVYRHPEMEFSMSYLVDDSDEVDFF